jgi:hypothetical protein
MLHILRLTNVERFDKGHKRKTVLSNSMHTEIVKDHVKSILRISSAHNKWGPSLNFFELKLRSIVYIHLQLRTRKVLDIQLICLIYKYSRSICKQILCSASSLVASVGNRDQWKNNGSAGLNGNVIERTDIGWGTVEESVLCLHYGLDMVFKFSTQFQRCCESHNKTQKIKTNLTLNWSGSIQFSKL